MKKLCFLLGLSLFCLQVQSQVIYGTKNYVQYHVGSLPIIISVPHGGQVAPTSIPDRMCNNPTTVWDNYTIELAKQIDSSLFNLTGYRPHLIICNLKRTKLDCNRNLADGACGNTEAQTSWKEFSNYIDSAQTVARNEFNNKAFYIDLHAHGHAIKNLEIGYNISANKLNGTDNGLNASSVVSNSSINKLVGSNPNKFTHAELIRGAQALGTLFGNANFPAVPSQQNQSPGTDPYFMGGYNTDNHTCVLSGNVVNGVQIETPSTVWSSYSNRKKFADSTAVILVKYLSTHLNLFTDNNLRRSTADKFIDNAEIDKAQKGVSIFPSNVSDMLNISLENYDGNYEVTILNTMGQTVIYTKNKNKLNLRNLAKGLYFVHITFDKRPTWNGKIIKD